MWKTKKDEKHVENVNCLDSVIGFEGRTEQDVSNLLRMAKGALAHL